VYLGTREAADLNHLASTKVSQLHLGSSLVQLCEKLAANAVRQGLSEGRAVPSFSSNFLSVPQKPPWRTSNTLKKSDPPGDVLVQLDVNQLQDMSRPRDVVRSATDSSLLKVAARPAERRFPDPVTSLYGISEFPSDGLRSVSVSLLPPTSIAEDTDDCHARLLPEFSTEPLLLVGPELEWEGHLVKKAANRSKKRRNQQMTQREMNKMTRTVIGYTLLSFVLVIFTFYIVYFF